MRWLDGITDPMDVSLSELWELVWGPIAMPCTCCRAIELDSEGATSQTDRVVQL